MAATYAERHIRALGLAKECAALGARSRTIEYVTGLSHAEIIRLFFPDGALAPRGRPPSSPEWYYTANLINKAEASIFVSIYRRIRVLQFGPAEALVSAYKHYLQVCVKPRISFDRAFDLASRVDGLWIVSAPNFSLMLCPACASQYVDSVGEGPSNNENCPFCKLVKRYAHDPRLQASFPAKASPDLVESGLG
jgi:flagellar transcriptional activator FlhC